MRPARLLPALLTLALFTYLLRNLRPGEPLALNYRSCGYGPGMSMIPEEWLDGDENEGVPVAKAGPSRTI